MQAVLQTGPDKKQVLAKAVMNAAEKLGLSRAELEAVLGRNRSGLTRDGLDPASKAGELALLLVRIYRSLFVLVGDDVAMKHWFSIENNHLRAIPKQRVQHVEGLVQVAAYLDAMRGKN